MPIEIRELIIKAFVDASGSSKKSKVDQNKKGPTERTIQESINQFAEILKQEKER
jgi:hypothetical protein